MSDSVLVSNGIRITSDIGEWYDLASKYGISPQEIGLIDFNRTGVRLDDNDVRIGFRTRFNGTLFYSNDLSWFALPVRGEEDSNFHIRDGKVYFNNSQIGVIDKPILDTCDTSYQRGKKLLNLNSRSRSNCAGCKACVHNDKSLYDDTVIKDKHELRTIEDIDDFFRKKERLGTRISSLDQIAVVTGLFKSEEEVLHHLQDVYNAATGYGFHGELMYFGCQLMSASALREFSRLGKTAIVFAIDNFAKRKSNLSKIKSDLNLEDFYVSMSVAKSYGIETTFAYIVGVDDLCTVANQFNYFFSVCTRFPIINIFQIQTNLQAQALHNDARSLEYYIKARLIIEDVFFESDMRPRRWENYRPLWYREFSNEFLDVKAYG
ncbi:hypothetical protein IKF67_00860 [Candidatus Saccharibacteria bacterium]|nr:hypothetical protein [Candidatus Saccharibacteria bacterium]